MIVQNLSEVGTLTEAAASLNSGDGIEIEASIDIDEMLICPPTYYLALVAYIFYLFKASSGKTDCW